MRPALRRTRLLHGPWHPRLTNRVRGTLQLSNMARAGFVSALLAAAVVCHNHVVGGDRLFCPEAQCPACWQCNSREGGMHRALLVSVRRTARNLLIMVQGAETVRTRWQCSSCCMW